MPKILVLADEYYPFYFICEVDSSYRAVEVDSETVARWDRVMAEFEQVQREMRSLGGGI